MLKRIIDFLEDVDEALEDATKDMRQDIADFLNRLADEVHPAPIDEENTDESHETDESIDSTD